MARTLWSQAQLSAFSTPRRAHPKLHKYCPSPVLEVPGLPGYLTSRQGQLAGHLPSLD